MIIDKEDFHTALHMTDSFSRIEQVDRLV